MKILGLRVREVGNFRQPVALEGLTGGLDVLAGPNEFGKSTLFRALEAAFSAEHTSKKAKGLGDWMVPTSGGAPVIEVDFEVSGARYRLRKRFFTSARASLRQLNGDLLLRGADAEHRLAEILGEAGGPDRLGVLWVGQRQSLEPLALADPARDNLKTLIADEVVDAVGGGAMDAIRRKVAERLGTLLTARQRKPVGAHKEASDLAARLMREAEAQREAVARGRDRLERLAVLREQHASLADAGMRRGRSDRIVAARSALETARAATDKRKAAEELFKRLEREQAAAAKDLATFDQAADDAAKMTARRKASAEAVAAQAATAALLTAKLATARGAYDAAVAAEQSAHAAVAAAQRAEAAQLAAAEAAVLAAKLADAEALALRIADLAVIASAKPALAPLRSKAESELRAVETLEAKLTAASVRIRIDYDKGGHGKILRDGAPVPADAEFAIPAETELAIAGIGRIAITPGTLETAEATLAQLAKATARLAALLAEAGVADVVELATRAESQTAAVAEHDRLAARLDGLCPEGLPALRARVSRLVQAATPHPGPLPKGEGAKMARTAIQAPPIPWGEGRGEGLSDRRTYRLEFDRLDSATNAREQAQAALATLQSEQQSLDLSAAALQAEAAMLAERQTALASIETSAEHRATLLSASETAAARAREAVLALQALREKEPDPQQLLAFEADLAAAISAETQGITQLNTLAVEMAGLESLLDRDALDGIEERLAETEEALAIAERTLLRIKTEIAALDLLESELAAAERTTRDAYLAPVTARLAPYLGLVLPGAELQLGEAFDAAGLTRDGRNESIARLSEGTREQIAVLVRLGLGRLLADRAKPMPLILDDALVYSDDERIAASFAALEKAAAHHQVIVLTCRAKAFEQLGGARLVLQPWQMTDD